MAIRRREKTMRALLPVLLVLLLSACSVLEGNPQPAPPVSDHPQEIRRNQTQGLREIGAVSAAVLDLRWMWNVKSRLKPPPQTRIITSFRCWMTP